MVSVNDTSVMDQQEKAVRAYESAWMALKRSTGGKTAQGLENSYGEAYQLCVRLGIRPQIRMKYRG